MPRLEVALFNAASVSEPNKQLFSVQRFGRSKLFDAVFIFNTESSSVHLFNDGDTNFDQFFSQLLFVDFFISLFSLHLIVRVNVHDDAKRQAAARPSIRDLKCGTPR